MPLLHNLLILLLFIYPRLTASQWVGVDYADAQYIFFNGTISGHFIQPNASCPEYFLGPHPRTYLLVGVNAPWDMNPFVFDLYHLATEGEGGIIVYTNDSIYNLDFTTAAYLCKKDGRPCRSFETWPYYYAGVEVVNLRDAHVERVSVGAEPGYSVTGDQKTWVSNETITTGVDIARPQNYTYQSECLDQQHLVWNLTTPFTYNVTFSNSTASATLFLNTGAGALTLHFSGDRSDSRHSPAIELNTSDPTKPTFTYANGSTIFFRNYSDGEWSATALQPPRNEAALNGKVGRWMMVSWAVAIVGLVAFA